MSTDDSGGVDDRPSSPLDPGPTEPSTNDGPATPAGPEAGAPAPDTGSAPTSPPPPPPAATNPASAPLGARNYGSNNAAATGPTRKLKPLMFVLIGGMTISAIGSVNLAMALFSRADLVEQIPLGATFEQIDNADDRALAGVFVLVGCYLVGLITLLVWLYAGSRNLERRGQVLERRPWLAWLCWIPIVHWILTPMLLNQLSSRTRSLHASASGGTRPPERDSWLIATYVVYAVTTFFGRAAGSDRDLNTIDAFASADRASAAAILASIIPAVLLVIAAWKITDAQDQLHDEGDAGPVVTS